MGRRRRYTLTKVRGAKTAVKAFTHEAADLPPILRAMRAIRPDDHDLWQVRYVLLLWLSLVCMLPFEMSVFDGAGGREEAVEETAVQQMAGLCRT